MVEYQGVALRAAWVIASAPILTAGAATAQVCSGDCDANSAVSASEVLTGLGIALDAMPVAACAPADHDHDHAHRPGRCRTRRRGRCSIDIGTAIGIPGGTAPPASAFASSGDAIAACAPSRATGLTCIER